jgi:hypothetical protein
VPGVARQGAGLQQPLVLALGHAHAASASPPSAWGALTFILRGVGVVRGEYLQNTGTLGVWSVRMGER